MGKRGIDCAERALLGVLALFCLWAFVYMPFGWQGFLLLFTGKEASAWANVVATLAGIGAAAAGLMWQVRRTHQQEVAIAREREVQRLHILSGVIATMYFSVVFYRWESEKGAYSDHDLAAIRRQVSQLDRLSSWDMPDWEAWHGAELALYSGQKLVEKLDQLMADHPPDQWVLFHHRRAPHLNVAEVNFRTAMECVTFSLSQRGAKHQPISYRVNGRGVHLTELGDMMEERAQEGPPASG